jgi:hypothetical protein
MISAANQQVIEAAWLSFSLGMPAPAAPATVARPEVSVARPESELCHRLAQATRVRPGSRSGPSERL